VLVAVFHFTSQQPDEATAKNVARLNALSVEQVRRVTTLQLEFLQGKHTAASFMARVDSVGEAEAINVGVLREVVRACLTVLRGSVRANSSATYVQADFTALGVDAARASAVAALWKAAQGDVKRAAVGHTLLVNELVDLEWSFGVTASNSELDKVADCYLHLALTLADGAGQTRRVPVELTLPQFYQLCAELEKARAATAE
jgi:hypothetical protein